MKVKRIYAVNFRNYKECCLEITSMVNIFYGQNAQGKTNLLEAMFYAAFGMSHRTAQEDDMQRLDTNQLAVGINFEDLHGVNDVKIKRQHLDGKNKKELFLNDVKVRPKEHYGILNMVMFSPEDLQLIKGEPALRRRFFDMQISQTDKAYYDLLIKYNRILQQRNRLLKDIRNNNASIELLLTWDQEFVLTAARIAVKRMAALQKLKNIAKDIYAALTGELETLTVFYELKANNGELLYPDEAICWEDFYRSKLSERQQVDILRGSTGIGPHRDDLLFKVNDRILKAFGSQGQQRSAALALKLAQLEYVRQEIDEFPVLLLDDVMSELDDQRRCQLLKFIDGKVQTFITVNDKALIPDLSGNAYFRIIEGRIAEG